MQTQLTALVITVAIVAGCDSPTASSVTPTASSARASPSTASAFPSASAAPSATSPRVPPSEGLIAASQILISYRGADGAPPSVVRTKVEAKRLAVRTREELLRSSSFEATARALSDDPLTSSQGGAVIGPAQRNAMPWDSRTVLLGLKRGELSSIIETPLGFHIVRRD